MFPILNPPPSPYHPSGSSQCTSPKHPVSCIEPGLATHFIHDIIHVSMSFSQIFPPSPSPTESIRLSIHQCLFCCLVHRVIVTIFLNETPVLWPPHAKSWLIGKDSDAGRDWRQEEKEMTEDEMAGWYHWLDGREFGWTLGVGDGQGGLVCCDSRGSKESDTTERLNWTDSRTMCISIASFWNCLYLY